MLARHGWCPYHANARSTTRVAPPSNKSAVGRSPPNPSPLPPSLSLSSPSGGGGRLRGDGDDKAAHGGEGGGGVVELCSPELRAAVVGAQLRRALLFGALSPPPHARARFTGSVSATARDAASGRWSRRSGVRSSRVEAVFPAFSHRPRPSLLRPLLRQILRLLGRPGPG